jgi:8-oxo-dGTP pyrophosphatase MutT (NUDIX family)
MSSAWNTTANPSEVPTAALVPRDAATLILIDRTGSKPRVLMGRRRDDLVFLPGKYVFPGGRVDQADRIGPADLLPATVASRLMMRMRGRPSLTRAHALARAAVRETYEETGLRVATSIDEALAGLAFVARAVTPPGRVRRYDTRFFLADAALVTDHQMAGDGELSKLDWFTFDEMRQLELPGITRLVVEDVAQLSHGVDTSTHEAAIPYYFHRAGSFQRDLL